jgi:hypothetical protein
MCKKNTNGRSITRRREVKTKVYVNLVHSEAYSSKEDLYMLHASSEDCHYSETPAYPQKDGRRLGAINASG